MSLKEKYDKIHKTKIVARQERFEFGEDNTLYKMFFEVNINPNVVEEQQREIDELRELVEYHLFPTVEEREAEIEKLQHFIDRHHSSVVMLEGREIYHLHHPFKRIIRALQAWAPTETHRLFLFPLLCKYENISIGDALDGIKYYGGFNHLYAELSKPYRGGDNHG